jgi:hypothetical protein
MKENFNFKLRGIRQINLTNTPRLPQVFIGLVRQHGLLPPKSFKRNLAKPYGRHVWLAETEVSEQPYLIICQQSRLLLRTEFEFCSLTDAKLAVFAVKFG